MLSINDLKTKANNMHDTLFYYDKKLTKVHKKHNTINDLKKDLDLGFFSVNIEGKTFECFYHQDIMKKPSHLYVIYSGARSKKQMLSNKIILRRWTYYPLIESVGGAILCIGDPMFHDFPELLLGWYYGNKEKSYIEMSLEIIKVILERSNISRENVIFFSSSGGGYASCYAASLLQPSLVISINPQIFPQLFHYAPEFERLTGINLHQKDILHRNEISWMIDQSKSKYCLLFNIRSNDDLINQLSPLCRDLEISFDYGITMKNNVLIWTYDAKGIPSPHSSVESRSLFYYIVYIAKKFKINDIINKEYYANLTNSFWCDLYEHKNTIFNLEKQSITMNRLAAYCIDSSINMGSESIIFQDFSIKREAQENRFHNYKYERIFPNTVYSIRLDTDANFDEYTVCLFDFANEEKVISKNLSTGRCDCFNFLTGSTVKDLRVCVYTGIAGKTKNNILFIKSITVMARSISAKRITDNSTTFISNVFKMIGQNSWSRGFDIRSIDHRLIPWTEFYELYCTLEKHRPRNILELGFGESSKLMAMYSGAMSATYLVIDEDREWSQSFLNKNRSFFQSTKVYISPLLNAEKGGYRYCVFRDFPRSVGSVRYDFILLHRPRGGDNYYPHMDIVINLPGIVARKFTIFLEHSDCIEEQMLIHDISSIFQKHNITINKRYISVSDGGEISILSNCEEQE